MKIYLVSLVFDVWSTIINDSNVLVSIPIDVAGKKDYKIDDKEMRVILCGLIKDVFVKVVHCKYL